LFLWKKRKFWAKVFFLQKIIGAVNNFLELTSDNRGKKRELPMNEYMSRITLVVCACAVIAISNQVIADDEHKGDSHVNSPLVKDPETPAALALEQKKLKEAEINTKQVGNILTPVEKKSQEVEIGPHRDEKLDTWPKKKK
jgi:hypothetical protein